MSFGRVSFDGDVKGGRGLGSGHGERKTTRQKTITEMIEEKMATEIKKQALSIKRSVSAHKRRPGLSSGGLVCWLAALDM